MTSYFPDTEWAFDDGAEIPSSMVKYYITKTVINDTVCINQCVVVKLVCQYVVLLLVFF